MAKILTSPDDVRRVLETAKRVAVLGANPDASRPAYYVPAYLQSQGYRLFPVNPLHAGKQILGEPVRATLGDLAGQAIDVVDVFRRSEAVAGHVDEVLSMKPLPKLVWLQSGIVNDEAARRWVEAGIDVIQDRCMLADHRRMLGG